VPAPDGAWVLARDGSQRALLLPVAGGAPRPVSAMTKDDWPLRFTPDGRALFVYRTGEVPVRISRIDLATGRREPWRELVPADAAGITSLRPIVAADGETYAYTFIRELSELYLLKGAR
jgi:hypothetical protein